MWAWILGIVGGRKWAAYALSIVAILAVIASIYGSVFLRGYRSAETKSEKKELQAQVTTARIQVDQLEAEKHENDLAVAALDVTQRADDEDFREIRLQARAIDEGEHARECSVSRDFVRLWDRALGVPNAAGGVVATIASAGDAGRDESEISQSDLLDNHIENAERARSNFAQCEAVIEWHRSNDRKPTR